MTVTYKGEAEEEPEKQKETEAQQGETSKALSLLQWPLLSIFSCVEGVFKLQKKGPVQEGRVPVFVMMPLDTITADGKEVQDKVKRKAWLAGLKKSGCRGIMVDVWWGLCEKAAGEYCFDGYLELCQICKELGLKVQAVMSFHQCGGNVGDSINIALPSYALEPAKKAGLLYKDGSGKISEDCLSLSADREKIFPSKSGAMRDALGCYRDFMTAFASAFSGYLGSTICEIQVGMGPCGELRYPSYMLSEGWNYPGVGLLCAYDNGMQNMLKKAAADAQMPASYGKVPDGAPVDTCAFPDASPLFAMQENAEDEHFRSGHGKFFLQWYRNTLLAHGDAVLREAVAAFPLDEAKPLSFSVKVSGIHWHTLHPSRAAESCAGYVPMPETGNGAYLAIARILAKVSKESKRPVFFNFTCLEMSNVSQGPGMPQADSAPEDLIAEVRRACIQERIPLCGENALQFGLDNSDWALNQIFTQMRGWAKGHDKMHAVTLLRLDDNFASPNSLKALSEWIPRL